MRLKEGGQKKGGKTIETTKGVPEGLGVVRGEYNRVDKVECVKMGGGKGGGEGREETGGVMCDGSRGGGMSGRNGRCNGEGEGVGERKKVGGGRQGDVRKR